MRPFTAVAVIAGVLMGGCAVDDPRDTLTSTTIAAAATPTPDQSTGVDSAEVTPGADIGGGVDPHEPVAADTIGAAPNTLGGFFTTSDAQLPSILTSNLIASGGEALEPTAAAAAFGVYGIPRPSGVSAAVMEIETTSTRTPTGSAISTDIVYLVVDEAPIDMLLARAGGLDDATTFTTIADYADTQGDPQCGRIDLAATNSMVDSVEGCAYGREEIADVRSVAFRRSNLLTNSSVELPPVFAEVPAALLSAGIVESYTTRFGSPSGPVGSTVSLRVDVTLTGPLPTLEGWTADGPNRWWSDKAAITVTAGTATWTTNTTQEQL